MPGTYPEKFHDFSSVKPNSYTKTLIDDAASGKVHKRKLNDFQRWEFDLTTIPFSYAHVMELYSFLCHQNGMFGEFYIKNPLPQPGPSPVILTAPEMAAGNNNANLSGNNYQAGQFIQFGNHDKVYLIHSVDGDLVSFMPNLVRPVPSTTPVIVGENVIFKVELESDTQDIVISASSGKYTPVKMDIRESI